MAESSKDYTIKIITCAECGAEDATMISHTLDIPYYDDYVQVSIKCKACGFRTSDFFHATSKGHTVYRYQVENADDMTTKVVRASDGIVRIPELGVSIEPVNQATSWIRNIEGILDDIEDKMHIALKSAEDDDTRIETKKRLVILEDLKLSKRAFEVIVEDVNGNSIILPATEEKLTIEHKN